MPPPPSQADPRSPRPHLTSANLVTAASASLNASLHNISHNNDSNNDNTNDNDELAAISRRIGDSRDRRNAERDAHARFRQRLRNFNASRTNLNLPLPPVNMVDSRARIRDHVRLQQLQLEEQNRARTAHSVLTHHSGSGYAPARYAVPATSATLRRMRRPSFSQLRPLQADTETSNAHRAAVETRPVGSRRRRSHLAESRSSPFGYDSAVLPISSATTTDLESDDQHARRLRIKRRKVTHEVNTFEGFDPVRYGWHGQVEPGHLRLEILSCDGGQYEQQLKYRAENLLRNDKSVYCSNSATCNLLFQHQAETSFNLDAMVIKGPESGYTHPVQQGLVFVGMSMDDLLESAGAYQMVYAGTSCPAHGADPTSSYAMLPPPPSLPTSQAHAQTHFSDPHMYDYFRDCDWPEVNDISEYVPYLSYLAPNQQLPSSTLTALGDHSDADEPGISAGTARGQPRTTVHTYGTHTIISSGRGRPPAGSPAVYDDEDEDDDDSTGDRQEYWDSHNVPELSHHSHAPGRIEKIVQSARKESEILGPSATFFIRRYQNRITVKFDPPLAGRYILVKLFNPHDQNGNIDVQYVAAYGYSGPRFMPAIKLR